MQVCFCFISLHQWGNYDEVIHSFVVYIYFLLFFLSILFSKTKPFIWPWVQYDYGKLETRIYPSEMVVRDTEINLFVLDTFSEENIWNMAKIPIFKPYKLMLLPGYGHCQTFSFISISLRGSGVPLWGWFGQKCFFLLIFSLWNHSKSIFRHN